MEPVETSKDSKKIIKHEYSTASLGNIFKIKYLLDSEPQA